MRVGSCEFSEDGQERRLLCVGDSGKCVEHGVHKGERLGLLGEVAGSEEGCGRAEGCEADLPLRGVVSRVL